MHIYSAFVRPGGSLLNEIPKIGLSAAEIVVLRGIHGNDSVIKIQWTGSDRRKHAAERDRLVALYGEKAFANVFGTGYSIKLPNELPDVPTDESAEVAAEEEAEEDKEAA
jgi:hypothetical protein